MATGEGEYRAVGRLGAVIQNAGWMLGGKGIGALLSLVYLALATRSLGPEGFGAFALILGTGQAVMGFVTFQTWQVVVRYGVVHLHEGHRDRLDRLQSFCLALDVVSALAGILIAALVITLLGGHFGWAPELRRDSLIFCGVLLASITSTPIGILRLHDRFAIAATAETVTPV
ncbi:MAG TPA: oligosaccharide flippase family protein, partial [Allosphingosinicella sp.]